MSRVVALPATPWDYKHLSKHLRRSDLYETNYTGQATGRPSDWSLFDLLMGTHTKSLVWTLWDKDGLVGCCGVVPQPEGIGVIWYIGTDLSDSNWRGMTRRFRRMVAMWHKYHRSLHNLIPIHMKQRIRWVVHLGFDLDEEPMQIGGKWFRLFRTAPRPE